MKWTSNPFTFSINPELHVGYKDQMEKLTSAIISRHKVCLLSGPTGSGKTTMLERLCKNLENDFVPLYIPKPPQKAEEFIGLCSEIFKSHWLLRPFVPKAKNLYQLPGLLNKRLRKRYLVLMLDEAHEADIEVLEWLRVLNDQADNMSVILSGLPVLEPKLIDRLETLRKRVAVKVEVLSLTKEETAELIKKRIQHVGGTGEEFSSVAGVIYDRTAGFPREVLRMCDELVNRAIEGNAPAITTGMIAQQPAAPPVAAADILGILTPTQREILEMVAKGGMTPGEIANALDLSRYKSRQHAVRSMNNLMKKLLEDGYLERAKSEKAFTYSLSPRVKTLFVKA